MEKKKLTLFAYSKILDFNENRSGTKLLLFNLNTWKITKYFYFHDRETLSGIQSIQETVALLATKKMKSKKLSCLNIHTLCLVFKISKYFSINYRKNLLV